MGKNFEFRDYQKESYKVGFEVLNREARGKRMVSGMIVNPTGAGKGFLVGKLSEDVKEPILVLQPSKELLSQNFKKFEMFGGKASICCSSLRERTVGGVPYTTVNGREIRCDEITRVTFGTIGSLTSRIDELKEMGVKKVIIDEAHLNSKPTTRLKKFLKEVGVTNILGLTATPFYLNGGMEGSRIEMINRTRGSIFKTIDYVVQISDISKDFWSPLHYSFIKTDQNYLQLNSSGTGYTEVSIRDFFQNNSLYTRIKEKVDEARKQGRKKIVVFVPTIEEAEILHKQMKGSLIVHSKMPVPLRKAMVDDFSYGKGDVIINVSVLSVGYDHSEIDCIIDAAPTNSIASFYQKLGRGVRQGKKKDCEVVDMAGNVGRFGKIEGLKIEDDEQHGWGLFSENGDILSHYSCNIYPRPKRGKEFEFVPPGEQPEKQKFHFGKHQGKTIEEVLKTKDGKGYCLWMTGKDSSFKAFGAKNKRFVEYVRQSLINLERGPKKEAPLPF